MAYWTIYSINSSEVVWQLVEESREERGDGGISTYTELYFVWLSEVV